MRINTIIFDLDDTLIETGAIFDSVIDNCCRRISERLDSHCPGREAIFARQEEIDAKLLDRSGITPERFAESLVETYRVMLDEKGLAHWPGDKEYLYQEGLRAFYEVPALSPDTNDVLTALKDREKFIYTWGREDVQMPRIKALNLEPRFNQIHCVSLKNADALSAILGARRPEETLVCGDSLKGEIAPALEIGCHAAHIVRNRPWSFHHAEVSGDYHKIDSLGEVIGVLAIIEGS